MLEQQSTAAVSGANVIVFPEPDDDTILVISGVTLADADAKVIARRTGPKKWKARTRFFNNIIAGSIDNMGKLVVCVKTK